MTTKIPSAVAQWAEPPTAASAVTLTHLYWHYDSGTTTWTLTPSVVLESGRLADPDGDGVFNLVLLGALPPGARTLALVRRSSDSRILVY